MDGDTLREFVADIRTESERLQRTTEKLLDLSRLDDGVQVLPEPVDLKQISLDALAGLAPLARERGIRIFTDLDDGCVILANGDDMGSENTPHTVTTPNSSTAPRTMVWSCCAAKPAVLWRIAAQPLCSSP